MKRIALLTVALAACGDPNLTVAFQLEGYEINNATLRIYQPVAAAPFDCDQVAFGLVDEDVLRLSLVSEISVLMTSEAPLEVDRTAAKLFWVEGFDKEGNRLVNGCAETGELEEDLEVVIRAEPTKRVIVDQQPSLSVQMGQALDEPIVFMISDLKDAPLGDVEVRWEIDAAGGSGSSGFARTSTTGEVEILPELPSRPGPFILDISVRWAERDPEPVSGFVRPEPEIGTLAGTVLGYRGGPIGPNGEPGFVALIDTGLEHEVVHVYRNDAGEIQQDVSAGIITSLPRLGLIEASRDGERARAIVISLDSWVEVSPGGALIPRSYTPPIDGLAPLEIEMSGSCEPGSPQQIFVSYEADVVGIFDDEGEGFGATFDFDLIASGCVTDEQIGGDRRLLILLDRDFTVFVATEMGDSYIGQSWLAFNFGIGFAGPIGDSTERFLLGTQLSVNEVVISRYVVGDTDSETVTLTERGLDSPTGVPRFTDGGDVDGDGLLDVVSLIDQGIGLEEEFALWAALGRERDGRRITGEFELGGGLESPEMILVDFDRDGTDDVIIGDRPDFGAVSTTFQVFSMSQVSPP